MTARYLKAAFVVVILALVVTGCSSRSGQGLGGKRARAQKSGAVSLEALTRENPDWLLVARTDGAIRRYQSILAMPALAQARPGVVGLTASSVLPAVPEEALPALPTSQSTQEIHLDRLAERQIARLTSSLAIAENERIEAQRKLALAKAQQDYLSGRSQINDRFLAVERAIIDGNTARVVNLTIQIKALRENAAGPRTAPDDYWAKTASQKEDELAGLKSTTAKQLELAQEASNAELASLQSRLNAQAQAQVDAMKATIDRENAAIVQDQKGRLQKQRTQILAMTSSLQKQVAASIASLKSTAAAKNGFETASISNWPAQMAATDQSVAASLPAWRTRLVSAIGGLQKQRDRQAALVTEETRRAVLQVAQSNGLRIVSWQGKGTDLTPLVLQSLQRERWGKA